MPPNFGQMTGRQRHAEPTDAERALATPRAPYYERPHMRFAVLSLVCGLVSALLVSSGCENRNRARVPASSAPELANASARDKPGGPAPRTEHEIAMQPATIAQDGLREIDGPGLIAEIRASKRKATLLNVWASWCGSCKRELPMLADLGKALESEGVAVMFVSVDKPQQRPAAVALLETLEPRPSSFIVQGSFGPFKRAINPRWKGALPATVLYDENGELLWFWPGPVLEHEITPIVTAHLAGAPLEGPTLVEPGPP